MFHGSHGIYHESRGTDIRGGARRALSWSKTERREARARRGLEVCARTTIGRPRRTRELGRRCAARCARGGDGRTGGHDAALSRAFARAPARRLSLEFWLATRGLSRSAAPRAATDLAARDEVEALREVDLVEPKPLDLTTHNTHTQKWKDTPTEPAPGEEAPPSPSARAPDRRRGRTTRTTPTTTPSRAAVRRNATRAATEGPGRRRARPSSCDQNVHTHTHPCVASRQHHRAPRRARRSRGGCPRPLCRTPRTTRCPTRDRMSRSQGARWSGVRCDARALLSASVVRQSL